jgi:threonine aldolase
MRQAGIFAAAGVVALDHMVERLAEDHENARLLGRLLSEADLPISVEPVESNMVYVELPSSDGVARSFAEEAGAAGVLFNPPKGGRVRMVTHYGIERRDIEKAAERIIGCVRKLTRSKAKLQGASDEARLR